MTQADDSRRRILDAATEEFARYGIAGARVDRVAQRSGLSKPMVYTYFSSKEGLFDAVFTAHVVANSDRVPFTPDDLTGYAVRLYDDYLADPALLRLVMWKRLERVETGYLFAGHEAHDAAHIAAIEQAQRSGIVRSDVEARDVWSILIATAATWAQNSITGVATAEESEEQHRRRRLALAAVVRDGLLAD